jgi:hypothetical protein
MEETAGGFGVGGHVFRVPLDAENEGTARHFDAFDHTIIGPGDRAKAIPKDVDGLMMAGVGGDSGSAAQRGEVRAGSEAHGMRRSVSVRGRGVW